MRVVIPKKASPEGRKVGEQDRGQEKARQSRGIRDRPGWLHRPGNLRVRHGVDSE
jgi:hypothetical protein